MKIIQSKDTDMVRNDHFCLNGQLFAPFAALAALQIFGILAVSLLRYSSEMLPRFLKYFP